MSLNTCVGMAYKLSVLSMSCYEYHHMFKHFLDLNYKTNDSTNKEVYVYPSSNITHRRVYRMGLFNTYNWFMRSRLYSANSLIDIALHQHLF